MARRKDVMDVREILRQLRMGEGNRAIAKRMRSCRKTIAKYRIWAEERGLLEGELPEYGELEKLLKETDSFKPAISKVEPYRKIVEEMRRKNFSKKVIFERLRDEHGFRGSYSGVIRFISRLEADNPEAFIRIEVAPGSQA